MIHTRHAAPFSQSSRRDAIVTFAVVLLAYAALDDITTDADTSFVVEWAALAACGVWVIALSWRLLQDGYRGLGSISIVAAVAGVGAGAFVRSGVDSLPAFLTATASLLWFFTLAAILAGQTARQYRRSDHHV